MALGTRHDAPVTNALTRALIRVAQDGGTMRLKWGWIEIDLEVAVGSIAPAITVAEEEAALYVGSWLMTQESQPLAGETMPPVTLTVSRGEGGVLRASFPSHAFGPPPRRLEAPEPAAVMPQELEHADAPRSFEYLLVPQAHGVFLMAWAADGVSRHLEKIYHEFEFEDGKPVRLVVRDVVGRVMGRGTRAGA